MERGEALKLIHGNERKGRFVWFWYYGQELWRYNPSSANYFSTNQDEEGEHDHPKEHLATLYFSYEACKRGS
jgi:hypothetical protein